MKRFGGIFRIGSATVAVVGVLVAVGSPPIAAAPAEGGPEELWQQFPLDTNSNAAVEPDPLRDARAPVRATPRAPEPAAVRREHRDATPWEAWQVALALAAVALLFTAGSLAVIHSSSAPRTLGQPRRGRRGPRPLRVPPSTAAMVAAFPPSRAVLEGLLRAAGAAGPKASLRTRTVRATSGPRTATHMSGGGMAKPFSAQFPKSSTNAAELFKHKPATDATTLLKAKERASDARAKEQLTSSERTLLKEKLAATPQHKRAALAEESPRRLRTGRKSRTKHAPVLRTVPEPPANDIPRPSSTRQPGLPFTRTCEIRWWRGYVMSEFFVVETTAEGVTAVIAASSRFRWHKRDPPEESPQAVAAFSALIERLEGEGWTVAGRGENWFSAKLQLQRRVEQPTRQTPRAG